MLTHLSNPQYGHIAGTGVAFPQRFSDGESAELDNQAVLSLLASRGRRGARTSDELAALAGGASELLGVERRRWAHRVGQPYDESSVTSCDLQAQALDRALADAGMSGAELGGIIAATSTPARVTAASAPALAARLGLEVAGFDVRAGCAGGLYALVQAFALASACGRPIAVAAGDTFSKILPPHAPSPALALGDGAGAVIVAPLRRLPSGAERLPGLCGGALFTAGAHGHLAATPGPFPPTRAAIEAGAYFLAGDAEALTSHMPGLYATVIANALTAADMAAEAIECFIPHQAGIQLIDVVRREAGITDCPAYINVADHGNIGAGSVFVALHEARARGDVGPGNRVLCAAVGGGICGAALILDL